MPSYGFTFANQLVNTGFLIVASGLSRGKWGAISPNGIYISNVNYVMPDLVYTTGDGTEGFLRLFPRVRNQTPVPASIPDAETLYIGWNIPEQGDAHVTLTAPSLYKLSRVSSSSDGPLAFTVIGDFGPDTCLDGYVWREAFAGDHVCVLPETRSQAAIDNERAASRVDPHGASGSKSCVAGYVWRQAGPGDDVCVSEATRQQVIDDNAAAHSRRL